MTTTTIGTVAAVSLLLGVALAATRCLRGRSAAERHAMLVAGVLSALLLPALGVLVPQDTAAAMRAGLRATLDDRRPATAPVAPAPAPAPAAEASADVTFRPLSPTAAASLDLGRAAPWIWIAGVIVVAARLILGLLRLRALTVAAAPVDSGPWREACDGMASARGITTRVALRRSDHPSLLATWGWRRPVVLLPRDAPDWTSDRIQAVLGHELAHVARRDWLHQIAGEALRTLHWFNPLAWLACRQLRVESERASDDAVLALGIDGTIYATHLVALARRLGRPRPAWIPAPAMVRPSSLEGRVHAMLNPHVSRRPASRRTTLLTAAVALAVALPLAALGAASQYHTLRGSLVDASGRVLPNAVVTLADTAGDRKFEVRSDRDGRFELVGLPPATYRLEVRTPGFRPHVEDVAIDGDTERMLRLAVGTLQETVTVVGGGQPEAAPDAATLAQRTERIQRAGARQQRALATCAAGPPTAVGGNILPPMKIVHVSPTYPEHLRPSAVTGAVTMRAVIDREGLVRDVQHVAASHPDLEAPAVDAIRQWQFTTTLLNCEPIEVEMTVTVNFSATP